MTYVKKWQDFHGTWDDYKAYLDSHGMLAPGLTYKNKPPKPEPQRSFYDTERDD